MKKLVTSYTFDASAKTVNSADFTSLEKIQLITNVTDNVIIYNFASPTKGGTLSSTTLTLTYDTTSMSDSDKLQIFVDDSTATLPTGAATSAKQDSLLTELQLKADLTETQPVSLASVPSHAVTNAGTFATQASQSGTWTVQPGNTANTTAWKVDGSAVTQPISASSLPLPSGAATSALQTQPGVDIGDVTVNNASGAAAVNIQDGGNSITVDGAVTATLAAETTKVIGTVNQGTSPWVTSNATTSVVGNGVAATAQRMTLANDSTGVIGTVGAVTAITNALPAGTNAIGKLAANSGVDIGDVDVTSLPAWGTVSTVNSTTANLAGGAVFTGTSENVSGYAAIQVSIFSSHASATDGLSLQQSSNGTNWDLTDTYTISAATGKVYSVQPSANFFRLVYTNGATLTTSLRIQTVFHVAAPNPSSQRPSDTYTRETDMTQTWAFPSLYNGTTFDLQRGDITNGLDVDVTRLPTLANVTTVGTVTTLTGTTTLTPGTGATNLGKAEDAAHTTGDVGVMDLGVRNDTLADQTNTNADYGAKSVDIKGRVMTAGAPRALKGNVQVQLSNTTTETTIIAATASTFHDVYGIILANTGATTTKVSIRDDTAGTVRAIIEVPTLETRGFMLPVDSAMTQTAVNKNWTAQCGSATTALEVTAFYVSMV